MKTKSVGATTILLLLLLAAGVGSKALLASSLAIAVAALYGATVVLLRRANAAPTRPSPLACLAGATIGTATLCMLVTVWSATVGLSVVEGFAAWAAFLVAGESYGRAIAWAERRRAAFVRMRLGFGTC